MIKGGVAFFDSGIGGLNVLAACLFSGLSAPVYYFGDNARAPYGNKSKEELAPFVFEAFDRFASLKVGAAVIACNTVTALFIDELRTRYPFPIVGCVPSIEAAAKHGGEIFVLATSATVNSARMHALIEKTGKEYPNATLRLTACEKLAGEIERHIMENGYDFTPFLPVGNPTSVVLGCTHYGYIRKEIEGFYGCNSYDNAGETAKKLAQILPFFEKERGKNSCSYSLKKVGRFFTRKRVFNPPLFSIKITPKKVKKLRKLNCAQPLYFLGNSRFYNAQFYKQMFVFKTNGREVVKNSQKNLFF